MTPRSHSKLVDNFEVDRLDSDAIDTNGNVRNGRSIVHCRGRTSAALLDQCCHSWVTFFHRDPDLGNLLLDISYPTLSHARSAFSLPQTSGPSVATSPSAAPLLSGQLGVGD